MERRGSRFIDRFLFRSRRQIEGLIGGDKKSMSYQLNNFVTRPTLIRHAIEVWREWLEEKIGAPLADAVIIETRHNFARIAVDAILGANFDRQRPSAFVRRLNIFFAGAELPPGFPPLVGFSRPTPELRYASAFGNSSNPRRYRIEWQDCPVSLRFHTISHPIVALNIQYQPGPNSEAESETRILVASRNCFEQLVRLLRDARDSRDVPDTHGFSRAEPQYHSLSVE